MYASRLDRRIKIAAIGAVLVFRRRLRRGHAARGASACRLRNQGEARHSHGCRRRSRAVREGCRYAGAAGEHEQADDACHRVSRVEGRAAQARGPIQGERACVADRRRAVGRFGHVRAAQHHGDGQRPDPGRHRAVGQRRRHHPRRRNRRHGRSLRQADDGICPQASGSRNRPSSTPPGCRRKVI